MDLDEVGRQSRPSELGMGFLWFWYFLESPQDRLQDPGEQEEEGNNEVFLPPLSTTSLHAVHLGENVPSVALLAASYSLLHGKGNLATLQILSEGNSRKQPPKE